MRQDTSGLIVAVVPAHNEEGSVGDVVRSLFALDLPLEVVVVDDASGDATAAEARAAGATVLSLSANLGIGGAVQTGLQYARDRGAAAAVQVDGDGQHPATALPDLVAPVVEGRADVVIGSRFLTGQGYQSSPHRRVGIALLSFTLRLLTGRRFSDPTSGFRAFSPPVVAAFAEEYPEDYPEPECLIDLVRRQQARIEEIPVRMLPRTAGRSSIRGPAGLYYMAKVLTAVIVGRLR